MAEEKRKEGEFDPEVIKDIYDTLTTHNLALRAFGTLLRSSDLSEFADQTLEDTLKSGDYEKLNLRWGLQQIIELYLAHQERILLEYVDQYHKSDIWLIKRASAYISMFEQGAFKSWEVAINQLREAISFLDIVISRDGELKEKAEKLKDTCMKYLREMKGENLKKSA